MPVEQVHRRPHGRVLEILRRDDRRLAAKPLQVLRVYLRYSCSRNFCSMASWAVSKDTSWASSRAAVLTM